MQFISVLLITASVLSLLSGVAILIGMWREYKLPAVILLGLSIGVFLWSLLLSGVFDFMASKDDFYYIWFGLFGVIFAWLAAVVAMLKERKETSKRKKSVWRVLLFGMIVASASSLVFDVLLRKSNADLMWISPVVFSISLVVFYFSLLKSRVLVLSSKFLKVLSYVILMSMIAVTYIAVFFLIATKLFKISKIDDQVIVLNFVMIVIVLLLLPLISEANSFIKSLMTVSKIDLPYIIKKLNQMAAADVDLEELAGFVADNLHFQYIGFAIKDKVYGSSMKEISKSEISEIAVMDEGENKEMFERLELTAMKDLRNAKGRSFGKMLVGKPLGKTKFSKKDLTQIDTIVNLVASVIDSEERLKA